MELMMHINTAFMILSQLGVGPSKGFRITEFGQEKWSDFFTDDDNLEAVKSYTYIRVRLLFDPPTNSFLIDAQERTMRELEWRMNVQADGGEDECKIMIILPKN